MEHAAARHRRCLQPEPSTPARTTTAPAAPTQQPGLLAARVQTLHPQVHDLTARGWGIHQIARHLRIDPKTVRRYLNTADIAQLLGPASTARTSLVDPFKPYLQARCNEGVTSTNQLLAEITAQGYRGGERTLRRYLISIRGTEQAAPPQPKVPSARQLAALIMRPDARLTSDERDALADACTRCPDLATIRDLAQGFTDLVRELRGTDLFSWLEQADHADVHELRRFANGIRKDLPAVTAGLTLPWSSGAVEGNVNRIKMIKRQMYGRANFDLLRKRVLAGN
ncbi:transposase [Hamadaea sp. NPDC051192]|uniref:transposase n=1 Tax=Hamadaea sp. NPDC051192 TaxID=3154940 RepID=UPI00343486AE